MTKSDLFEHDCSACSSKHSQSWRRGDDGTLCNLCVLQQRKKTRASKLEPPPSHVSIRKSPHNLHPHTRLFSLGNHQSRQLHRSYFAESRPFPGRDQLQLYHNKISSEANFSISCTKASHFTTKTQKLTDAYSAMPTPASSKRTTPDPQHVTAEQTCGANVVGLLPPLSDLSLPDKGQFHANPLAYISHPATWSSTIHCFPPNIHVGNGIMVKIGGFLEGRGGGGVESGTSTSSIHSPSTSHHDASKLEEVIWIHVDAERQISFYLRHPITHLVHLETFTARTLNPSIPSLLVDERMCENGTDQVWEIGGGGASLKAAERGVQYKDLVAAETLLGIKNCG